MPIFEYACPSCGFVNEVLVKGAEGEAPVCPKCGHKKTEKRFSTFSAVVKNPAAGESSKCRCCPNSGCPSFQG